MHFKIAHHPLGEGGCWDLSDLDIVHVTHLTKTPSDPEVCGSHLEIHLRPSAYEDTVVRA